MSSIGNKLKTLLVVIVMLVLAVANLVPAQAAITTAPGNGLGKNLWQPVAGTPPPGRSGAKPAVKPRRFGGYKLNHGGIQLPGQFEIILVVLFNGREVITNLAGDGLRLADLANQLTGIARSLLNKLV